VLWAEECSAEAEDSAVEAEEVSVEVCRVAVALPAVGKHQKNLFENTYILIIN
jgi:hypothetical protein